MGGYGVLTSFRVEEECIEFNVFDFIECVLKIMSARAREKGIPIMFDRQPGVPCMARGDPEALLSQSPMWIIRWLSSNLRGYC